MGTRGGENQREEEDQETGDQGRGEPERGGPGDGDQERCELENATIGDAKECQMLITYAYAMDIIWSCSAVLSLSLLQTTHILIAHPWRLEAKQSISVQHYGITY